MKSVKSQDPIVCTPKGLPRDQWVEAARAATKINPLNHPPIERLSRTFTGFVPTPEHIAVLTTKYFDVRHPAGIAQARTALALGASSGTMALAGLVAGSTLGRRSRSSAGRLGAAGLIAASFVLLWT